MSHTTAEDARGRLDYLAEAVELLYSGAAGHRVVLPSTSAPRLLVPARPYRAAAKAAWRYTAQQPLRERLVGGALAGATLLGYARTRPAVHASSPVPDGGTIDDHLAEVLGQPVVSALALTRNRANRKPVLQVFDRRGHTIAFAKVGVSALAGGLVDAEAQAISRLQAARLQVTQVPQLLSDTSWRELPVLVTSALPAGRPIQSGTSLLGAAMREISAVGGGTADAYVAGMRRRSDAVGPAADPWRATFEQLVGERSLAEVPIGAWHGDWTVWNCARHAGRVVVWDWERFAEPAPVGFDALHFRLNAASGKAAAAFRRGAQTLVTDAAGALRPWGLGPAEARTVTLFYVLDIALRYLHDDARKTDAAGEVGDWALPLVHAELGQR